MKLTSIAIAVNIAGCSFKEDRKDIIVPIIDAAPAQTSNEQSKPEKKPKENTTVYTYTVRSGDTLGTIAQEYLGSSSRYTELLKLNKLDTNDAIYVGQKLKLPTEGLKIPKNDSVVTTNKVNTNKIAAATEYPELDQLLEDEQYNQAIQWILSSDSLETDKQLQSKLVTAALAQSQNFKRQQKTADAESLLSGLIGEAPMTQSNKVILEKELSKLRAEQRLLQAKQYADKSQFNESYNILLEAWKTVGKPLEDNILFTTTRNKVSESYHQKALRHYRNQELEDALVYWDKILAINPNDDLALVYQDRVKALQNKLENL